MRTVGKFTIGANKRCCLYEGMYIVLCPLLGEILNRSFIVHTYVSTHTQ